MSDDENGALRMAVQWQEPGEILQLLLDNGANTELCSESGVTVLHDACSIGNKEATLMLPRGGAHIHTRDAQGNTALHWAVRLDQVNILQVLLEHGAEVDVKTNHGDTP